MKLCICQICICGQHHCDCDKTRKAPYGLNGGVKDPLTEFKDRYRVYAAQAREKPFKPQQDAGWFLQDKEYAFPETTTKGDYVAYPVNTRTLKRPPGYKKPKGIMASGTTYKFDYRPVQGKMRDPYRGTDCAKDGTMPGTLPGRMERESTYGKAYTQKPVSKREKYEGKGCTLTVLGQPFTGEAETKHSYYPQSSQKRALCLPKHSGTLKTGGEFQGVTTHKTDFEPKPINPVKPIKRAAKTRLSEDPFADETTHSHDYPPPRPQDKAKPFLPEGSNLQFEGPFAGHSHYKKDYPPHHTTPMQLPEWHPLRRRSKKSSEAPMDGRTTYKTDYEPPPEDVPVESAIPGKDNLFPAKGPMERQSVAMRAYQRISNPEMVKSCRPVSNYEKPEGEVSKCTTTRHDYTVKSGEKAQSAKGLKPPDTLKSEKGPMSNMTTNRVDFQHMLLDCPAKYLKLYGKNALSHYRFQSREGGHDYFSVGTSKRHVEIPLKA